jgi:AbrB family looped-hinge helix DNA binding protein
MKEKGQITIPAAVREKIAAHKGDVFEVVVSDGNIVLKPQDAAARPQDHQKPTTGVDIGRFIGSGKGLFETPEDVDTFIRSERDQWE